MNGSLFNVIRPRLGNFEDTRQALDRMRPRRSIGSAERAHYMLDPRLHEEITFAADNIPLELCWIPIVRVHRNGKGKRIRPHLAQIANQTRYRGNGGTLVAF